MFGNNYLIEQREWKPQSKKKKKNNQNDHMDQLYVT